MRSGAGRVVPNSGLFKSDTAFFRAGRPGGGAAVLTAPERADYQARVAALGPAEVVAWLHAPGAAAPR
jgi:hypothetical protein